MERIETIQDFKVFINSNKKKLLEKAVKIEDLPPDDEWINDTAWDEIYAKEDARNGKL